MLRWLLLLCVLSFPGFSQEEPLAREDFPTPHSLTPEQVERTKSILSPYLKATGHGLNVIRIWVIADNEEWASVKEIIEEGEHAVEPPMKEERFWRRKLEILKSLGVVFKRELPPVFDFRRSFQNVVRLSRVSENFETPWAREMLVNAATMFAITHGSEFVSGVTMGTYHLAHGDFAHALAWYGLALPGLYDFGCWIGQGVLLVRPGRSAFGFARRIVVMAGGRAIRFMGIPRAMEAIFEREDVRERILRAQARAKTSGFEIQIPDEEVMRLKIRDREGREVVQLQFGEGKRKGELVLKSARFAKELRDVPYADLYPSLKDLGWNVIGAVRQAHYLIRAGQEDLIASEKTFVSAVNPDGETIDVDFREEAVWMKPKRKLSQAACRLIHRLVGR